MKFRFSKYDPKYRTGDLVYTKDEWTSYHDIGKSFGGKIFTLEDYVQVEEKYVQTLNELFAICKSQRVQVNNLEKYFEPIELNDVFKSLSEGEYYKLNEIEDIIRLCIREYCWCELSLSNCINIKFGYDYYIHVELLNGVISLNKAHELIKSKGLFIG